MNLLNHKTLATLLLTILALLENGVAQSNLPFLKRRNDGADVAENSRACQGLSQKDGPWLILCWSFTGEDAEQLARQMANELHQHRLRTYIYRHEFDYSGTTVGLGWTTPNEDDGEFRVKKMRTANSDIVNEVAVLVGDFSSVDDPQGQKALKKIKSMAITSIPEFAEASANASRKKNQQDGPIEIPEGGPLRTAFMLPNPMLPDEFFRRDSVDEFVVKINKKLEYSLLNCPGLYSVKIASFRGSATIDPTRIKAGESSFEALQRTGKSLTSSRLADAEEKAHTVTEALRRKGVEAYEFHDREESYVCIGSFDWVTRESNGTVLNNPDIVRIVNKCQPTFANVPGNPNAIVPKSISGIPLDPDPTPIMVPKVDGTRTAGRLNILRR